MRLYLPSFLDRLFEARRLRAKLQAQTDRLHTETLARVDAEAALGIRTDLMKALAHELRAPLTPIVAELALLELEPHAGECVVSIRAIRKHVEEQAEIIARLLDHHNVPEITEDHLLPMEGARPRILLVEDHEPTRTTLKQLLWRYGFKVHGVSTVQKAIETAREQDFVLCDIGLPDGSGYDVMRELKKRRLNGVAISGYGTEEDHRRSIEAGFSAHMTKPLDMKRLLQAIAEYSTPYDTPPPASPEANQERAA